MRVYLLILGVFAAALVFTAMPASAHAHGHEPSMGDAGVDGHDGGHDQSLDDGEHNPIDHSHPIGEDDYHSKASHSSLDFAHQPISDMTVAGLMRACCPPRIERPLRGIALSPPTRPPLV